MFENKIIFEKFHEYNGTWRKIVVERSTGDHVDPYLFTPDNVKLRSNNDLIDYLAEHPEFWDVFDGKILNLERKEKPVKLSASTKKLVEFLSAVNSGVSCKEALHSLQHTPKPAIKPKPAKDPLAIRTPKRSHPLPPKKRKLNAGPGPGRPPKIKIGPKKRIGPKSAIERISSNGEAGVSNVKKKIGPKSVMQARKKIGPKSVMERRLSGNKSSALSREVITQLEKHFCTNLTKPSPSQMELWAAQLNVNYQSVDEWFRAKWKAKLDYEHMKTKQKEELDEERPRDVKSFEPTMMPEDHVMEACDEGLEIDVDNAEEDD